MCINSTLIVFNNNITDRLYMDIKVKNCELEISAKAIWDTGATHTIT